MIRRFSQPEWCAQLADAALHVIEARGIGQLTGHCAPLAAALGAVAARVATPLDERLSS